MFSPRILVVLAIGLTIAVAIPADRPFSMPVTTITEADLNDSTWLTFPLFGNLFAPLWKLFPTFNNAGLKIITNDDKSQIVISVKDYKKSELKVQIKNGFIIIQGTHIGISTSQFSQILSLPKYASSTDVIAELTTDAYLVVTALLKPGRTADTSDRDVEITDSGKPFEAVTSIADLADIDDRTKSVVPIAPISDSDGDRKELTTETEALSATLNSALDGATDQDNSIPRGNEVIVP